MSTSASSLKSWEPVYSAVRTYKDALRANIRFLRGELDQSATHLTPLDKETLPLVKPFVEIHRRGVMTHDSQPNEVRKSKHYKTGKPILMVQRAYILGVMPCEVAINLKRYIDEGKPGRTVYYVFGSIENEHTPLARNTPGDDGVDVKFPVTYARDLTTGEATENTWTRNDNEPLESVYKRAPAVIKALNNKRVGAVEFTLFEGEFPPEQSTGAGEVSGDSLVQMMLAFLRSEYKRLV